MVVLFAIFVGYLEHKIEKFIRKKFLTRRIHGVADTQVGSLKSDEEDSIDREMRELIETESIKILIRGNVSEEEFCDNCEKLRGNVCFCPWCGVRNLGFRAELVSCIGEAVPGLDAWTNEECLRGHPNKHMNNAECPEQPYCIWCGKRLFPSPNNR